MEKKSTGKTIAIVILIILLLGILGYITYDKFIAKDDTIELQKQVKSLNKQIENLNDKNTNLNDNTNTSVNPLENLVGVWVYKASYTMDVNNECELNVKLDLRDDGTYTYEYGSTCAGGTLANGTYALGKDKIYLYNEDCKPVISSSDSDECTYPNCETIIVIDYKNGKMTASTVGGRIANLELSK